MVFNKKNILRLVCFSVLKKVVFLLIFLYASNASALTYEDYPVVKLRSLDKITARTMTFEAKVGSTVRFGQIFIKVQSCRKPPPVEKSEAAAFLQVWQADEVKETSKWIFSGWMFASSPALSAMDHPVYDVWVLDCLGRDPEPVPVEETGAETPATDGEAPDAVPPSVEPDTVQPDTHGNPSDEVTPDDDPGAFEGTGTAPQTDTSVGTNGTSVEEPVPSSNMPADAEPSYIPAKEGPDTYQDETVDPATETAPLPAQQQAVPATQPEAPAKQEFEGIY